MDLNKIYPNRITVIAQCCEFGQNLRMQIMSRSRKWNGRDRQVREIL